MTPLDVKLTQEQREAMRLREEAAARADIERMRREAERRYYEGIRRKVKGIHDQEKG